MLPLALLCGCSSEPDGMPGEVYAKYASTPGLAVAQVSGFELCDSVSVEVVLVVADNDDAWQSLAAELDIRTDEGSTSWLADTADAALRTVWDGRPVLRVVASPARRTVALYRLDSETQYDALIDYQLNQSAKKQPK